MTVRIGLTGGIGCGKSTVAALFREFGATVIDSDAISHQLTQSSGAAIETIRAAFGAEYIDANGALDRARMRHLVFSDMAAKQRLEGILHPLIRAQILEHIQAARAWAAIFCSSSGVRTERLRLADDIINNDAGMDTLRHQVERLHMSYLALSTGSD